MSLTIKTDHKWRNTLCGYELTDKERADFDYIDADEIDSHPFIRYRGIVYDLCEFMSAPDSLSPWQGVSGNSYFSGVVIRYSRDCQQIQIGTYFS